MISKKPSSCSSLLLIDTENNLKFYRNQSSRYFWDQLYRCQFILLYLFFSEDKCYTKTRISCSCSCYICSFCPVCKEVCNGGVACCLLKLGSLEKTIIASLFHSGLHSGTIFCGKMKPYVMLVGDRLSLFLQKKTQKYYGSKLIF